MKGQTKRKRVPSAPVDTAPVETLASKSGECITYYLSQEELERYRAMPKKDYSDTNGNRISRPVMLTRSRTGATWG